MPSRTAIALLLAACLGAATVTVACNGGPTPRPRRPGTAPRPDDRTTAAAPTAPAPKGPDVSKSVTLSFEIDALARLDRRILAVLPPLFRSFARGQVLQHLLPGIARDLGLNVLALDAVDHSRASAFAMFVKRKGKDDVHFQTLAAVPIKGDGQLVIDGLKASYESTTATAWGGLEIKRGYRTIAWVRIHKGWVVVAPTAPLLDSAYRYLVPRATRLPAGRVRAHLNARALIQEITPLVSKAWRQLGPNIAAILNNSALGRWLAQHRADLETIGTSLASLDSLSLELQTNQKDWRWHLDVKPLRGGPMAKWIGKQQAGAGFGLKVLPPGPFVALSDWVAPELRSLVQRMVSSFTRIQLGRITNRLPRQVALRGLYKRKRPASYYQYRKTLRDLNLSDYRASHQVYLVLWHVHAFTRHLEKALPPLRKTATGKTAVALYPTAGPGLGYASVGAIKDPRRHLRLYKNALWTTLKNLNRLAREAWKLMHKKARKHLGQTPPFQFVFRQTVARVGRIPVSAVALRIKWPAKPRGKLTDEQRRAHRDLTRYRALVESVLGKGDIGWAWAYVGKRVLVSAGRDWKPRILGMVKAALGKGGPTLDKDPLFTAARKLPTKGKRLGLVLFSATRLMSALLKGLFKFQPRMKRNMQLRMLNQVIQQDAKQARVGTLLEVLRLGGGYRFQSVLPNADVRPLLIMGSTWLVFGAKRSSHHRKPAHTKPAHAKPPLHP
jgi:hypothetical protein